MYVSILKQEKLCFNDATHHRNSSQSAIFSSSEDTILLETLRFIDACQNHYNL
jgi:hypothetical protein